MMRSAAAPMPRGEDRPAAPSVPASAEPAPAADPAPASEPLTAKGRRTRERILRAAREEFGARGYANVRISDISAAAGISHGAFYRYFPDRRRLMLELLETMAGEVYGYVRAPWDEQDPASSVRATTLRYFEYYRTHHAFFGLVMELSPTDPEVAAIGASARERFYARITASLERGAAAGVVRGDVDLRAAAEMLGSMTEFYAFQRFMPVPSAVSDIELEIAAGTVADIWMTGVGVDDDPVTRRRPPGRSSRPSPRRTGR